MTPRLDPAVFPQAVPPDDAIPADPFRYGWRYVCRTQADGTKEWEETPLTLEDVLYPQEGDVIPQAPLHEQECGYLAGVFRTRLPQTGGLVLSDCLVNWGVPGLRNHSPDISVFLDVSDPPDPRKGTFILSKSGGRCILAMELVSPDTRTNDVVRKLADYHRARVPLYVIVDQEREGSPRRLLGFRYSPKRYEELPLDEQGRVLLASLKLRLGLHEDRIVCFDSETDAKVGDYTEVTEALEAAEQRIRELEAEIRRLHGGPKE